MRIKAKITPQEKAINRRETQKYKSTVAKGIMPYDVVEITYRSVFFNGKINQVKTIDLFLND